METMQAVILDASVRAAALAVVVWAVLAAARVKDSAVRHAAWRGLLYAALALPLLSLLLPEVPLRLPSRFAAEKIDLPAVRTSDPRAVLREDPPLSPGIPQAALFRAAERPTAARWHDIAPSSWAFAAWAIVAGALLLRLAARARRAWAIARHASPSGLAPHILESAAIDVPAAFGMLTPVVLLPVDWRSWPEAKLRAVLAHEEAHLRRGDARTMALAELYCALAWFHPLAWWLRRELADLAEQVADDQALAVTGRTEYAELLLGFFAARSGMRLEGVSMAASGSNARRRIERILEAGRRLSRGVTVPGALALAGIGLPLVWIAASAQPARPPAPAPAPPPAPAAPRAPGAPRPALAPLAPVTGVPDGIVAGFPGGVRIGPGTASGENFVILDGERTIMSGSHWDVEHARAIANKLGVSNLIWFRREGTVRVITDRATIDAAKALWQQPADGDPRQRAAENRQRQMETEMELLQRRMDQVKAPLPDLTANLDKIRQELVRGRKEATQDDLSRLQEMVGQLQEEIGRQQEVFSRKHEGLSREMEKLVREMEASSSVHQQLLLEAERHGEKASRELAKLLAAAAAKGLAKPEPQ